MTMRRRIAWTEACICSLEEIEGVQRRKVGVEAIVIYLFMLRLLICGCGYSDALDLSKEEVLVSVVD